jgi:AcrR family transcriptional regulator
MIAAMPTSAQSGVQPKRKRGHLRVAAIMQAGVEVFSEKGYDAATMSEIAARSGTAAASLYRFFPSKESLADALLTEHAKYALGGLAELRGRAADMALADVIGALIDLRMELQARRKFAVQLADARGGSDDKRRQFREAMVGSIAALLREVAPKLAQKRADVAAAVVLHTLKGVANVESQKPAAARALLAEIKEMLCAYLASMK